MFTTSRYASLKLRSLALLFSGLFSSNYVSRGKKTIDSMVESARRAGDERLFVLNEKDESQFIGAISINELGEWNWIADKIEVEYELSGNPLKYLENGDFLDEKQG